MTPPPRWMSFGGNCNHNVLYTFLYKFSDGIAQGIWSLASMATYIYLLENNSTKYVGLAQGIQGTFGAMSAVPAGWLADRSRRDRVLKCCAIISCGAIACTTAAVLLPQDLTVCIFGTDVDHKYLWLCFALALWGLGSQGAGPVVEALLADSTRTGSRAKVYSFMFSASLAGMSIGPCAAAATFAVTGNKWDVGTLQHVILVGMALALLPTLALLCFDDDRSLGPESDAVTHSYTSLGKTGDSQRPCHTRSLSNRCVPYILASSDILFGLASGMTAKFFPIFFLKQVELPPVGTNFVFAGTPLCVAAMCFVASPIAQVFGKTPQCATFLHISSVRRRYTQASPATGRVPTILVLRLTGVGVLGFMGLFPEMWTKLGVIIPLHILRTAIVRSAAPLEKSILMDYVPKVSRGRWNSLEGVRVLGWSGSALLGGVLLDKYGFSFTFCITALVQGIATCFLVPLLVLVPRKEDAQHAVSTAAMGAVAANTSLAATDTECLAEGQVTMLNTLDEDAPSAADELHELEQPLLLTDNQEHS